MTALLDQRVELALAGRKLAGSSTQCRIGSLVLLSFELFGEYRRLGFLFRHALAWSAIGTAAFDP